MIRPINIYALSRIRDEQAFCIVEKHDTGHDEKKRIGNHEIDSLRLFVNNLIADDIKIENLDGFFYGFTIPQIGKEFDLLKINDIYCVNIELKSTKVDKSKILSQLLKNRHYLNHLGKRLSIYSIITDEMSCYKLSMNNELIEVDFSEIIKTLKLVENGYLRQIDDLFKASQYLVSPLNTPEKFIQGEYFLTQAQEQIKRELLEIIDKSFGEEYFHLTGKPGTGKTLLLYDIAKTLSKNGATAIVHCGKLIEGQRKISDEIDNLDILSVEDYDTHHVIGQEFDEVVMLMDASFFYSEDGELQGVPHPNPDYLYPNLFYQGITRVREKLAIIVVDNLELFSKIATILE